MEPLPIAPADRVATALLPLIGEGATAPEVAARASSEDLRIDAGTATRLIERLAELGLVRVAEIGESGDARYVLTTLGQRGAEVQLGSRPELVLQLGELERLRTELLATIAHELRTPLTAIRTCVGLLLDVSLFPTAEERQQLLATIERSADRMQRLLEDLLDLARFRAGRVTLSPRRFDALGLTHDVVSAMRPLADMAGQHFVVSGPHQPLYVVADRRRLEQALLNLASNAQKFSPAGETIEITLGADDGRVRWTVIDHGPGIAEADQARLFERFFVGASDRSGPQGGVGLGLPTALAIAQAHGGTIEVESELGRGSRFSLVVPASSGIGLEDDA